MPLSWAQGRFETCQHAQMTVLFRRASPIFLEIRPVFPGKTVFARRKSSRLLRIVPFFKRRPEEIWGQEAIKFYIAQRRKKGSPYFLQNFSKFFVLRGRPLLWKTIRMKWSFKLIIEKVRTHNQTGARHLRHFFDSLQPRLPFRKRGHLPYRAGRRYLSGKRWNNFIFTGG